MEEDKKISNDFAQTVKTGGLQALCHQNIVIAIFAHDIVMALYPGLTNYQAGSLVLLNMTSIVLENSIHWSLVQRQSEEENV